MSGLINLAYKTSAGITKLDEVNYSSASDEFKEVSLKASNGGNVTYAYTTNDSTYEEVTSIHIKKDGQEYRVISKYILPIPKYEKVTFDKAGTYTWTCPKGITKVRVTLAGAGGGSLTILIQGQPVAIDKGPSGELLENKIVSVTPLIDYVIQVGTKGFNIVNYADTKVVVPKTAEDVHNTIAFGLTAHGGHYLLTSSGTYNGTTTYTGGGKGGTNLFNESTNAQDGWCIIEYGTDIQGTSTSSSPKPGFGYEPDNPDPEPPEPDKPEPDNPTPDD